MTQKEWLEFSDQQLKIWTKKVRKNKNGNVSVEVSYFDLPRSEGDGGKSESLSIFVCIWGNDGKNRLIVGSKRAKFDESASKKEAMARLKEIKAFLKGE